MAPIDSGDGGYYPSTGKFNAFAENLEGCVDLDDSLESAVDPTRVPFAPDRSPPEDGIVELPGLDWGEWKRSSAHGGQPDAKRGALSGLTGK